MSPSDDKPIHPVFYAGIAAALFALTLVTYLRALDAGFLFWDDNDHVTANRYIQSLSVGNLVWTLTSFHANNWHPATWISHAVVYQMFGMEAWGHHLANVVLHGLNTLGVFALGVVLVSIAVRPDARPGAPLRPDPTSVLAAGVAALLFGVHPQHVESVAWIAERKDVLFLFFLLPALLAWVFYTRATSTRKRVVLYSVAFACFVLSISSKSMAVSTPILLLLLDFYPLHRTPLTKLGRQTGADARALGRVVLEKLPFLAVSAAAAAVAVVAQGAALVEIERVGPGYRILNACNSLVLYISKWALPTNLSPYYTYDPSFRGFPESLPEYLPVIAIVAFVTIAAVVLWLAGRPLWIAVWSFYLVTLMPVLGLVTVGMQSSADRYAYLPTLPFYWLVGYGFARLLCAPWTTRVLQGAAVVGSITLVAVSMRLTHGQIGVWLNDVRFWEQVERQASDPDAWIVQAGLAKSYRGAGELERAVTHYRAVLEIKSNDPQQRHDLALTYLLLDRLPEAVEVLPKTNAGLRDGALTTILGEIARAYCLRGDGAEALRIAERATALDRFNTNATRVAAQAKSGACR